MNFAHVLIALAIASTSGAALAADETVGFVKNVAGSVTLIEGSSSAAAAVGAPVTARSAFKTGADGAIGISLRDDTLLSLGPNTEFALRDYAFAPHDGKLSLVGRITRGTLNYVSGVIAKLKPDAVSIETPSSLLGVRGTQFVVKVDDSEVAK